MGWKTISEKKGLGEDRFPSRRRSAHDMKQPKRRQRRDVPVSRRPFGGDDIDTSRSSSSLSSPSPPPPPPKNFLNQIKQVF